MVTGSRRTAAYFATEDNRGSAAQSDIFPDSRLRISPFRLLRDLRGAEACAHSLLMKSNVIPTQAALISEREARAVEGLAGG